MSGFAHFHWDKDFNYKDAFYIFMKIEKALVMMMSAVENAEKWNKAFIL